MGGKISPGYRRCHDRDVRNKYTFAKSKLKARNNLVTVDSCFNVVGSHLHGVEARTINEFLTYPSPASKFVRNLGFENTPK